jgi:hypothetical protein
VAITDAGSNMLLAMKISRTIDCNLRCIDHVLNTSIKEAWKADTPIAGILKSCTDLCTYVHRSSLAAGHIRQVYMYMLFNRYLTVI